MFQSSCTATVEDIFKYNMINYQYPEYANVRNIDMMK